MNHTEIVNEMKKYPEKIQIVRFDKGVGRGKLYNQQKTLQKKGCDVVSHKGGKFTLARWSDNNHFTTKKYYEIFFEIMGQDNGPPEGYFIEIFKSNKNIDCFFGNQWLYNYISGDPYLKLLDGRLTQEVLNKTLH